MKNNIILMGVIISLRLSYEVSCLCGMLLGPTVINRIECKGRSRKFDLWINGHQINKFAFSMYAFFSDHLSILSYHLTSMYQNNFSFHGARINLFVLTYQPNNSSTLYSLLIMHRWKGYRVFYHLSKHYGNKYMAKTRIQP